MKQHYLTCSKIRKSIFLSLICTLFFNLLSGQTTLEEYNYITKGYKIQIESGLDMKKGYRFEDFHTNATTTPTKNGTVRREMSFKGLFKDGELRPSAVMIIYKRLDNNYIDYICIPHWDSSKDIWNMCFDKIAGYKDGGATALVWGLSKSSSFFSNSAINLDD